MIKANYKFGEYESPAARLLSINTEGILCQSGGIGSTQGDFNDWTDDDEIIRF